MNTEKNSSADKIVGSTDGLAVTDEQVLKATYESGLHQYAPGVLRTIWKDGIEIDEPSFALMNFVRKLRNS